MSRRKKDDYVEDVKEWQDHQYDPYYFTGSRMPYFYKKPSRKMARFLFANGVATLILLIYITIVFYDPEQLLGTILSWIVVGGMAILFMSAGKNGRKKRLKKKKLPVKFR